MDDDLDCCVTSESIDMSSLVIAVHRGLNGGWDWHVEYAGEEHVRGTDPSEARAFIMAQRARDNWVNLEMMDIAASNYPEKPDSSPTSAQEGDK